MYVCIQGHVFWGPRKADDGLHITIILALSLGSEDTAKKTLKIAVFDHHTVI